MRTGCQKYIILDTKENSASLSTVSASLVEQKVPCHYILLIYLFPLYLEIQSPDLSDKKSV
jgi:hypothetical protein